MRLSVIRYLKGVNYFTTAKGIFNDGEGGEKEDEEKVVNRKIYVKR